MDNAILSETEEQIKLLEKYGDTCNTRAIIHATAAMRYLEYGLRSEVIERTRYNELLNKLYHLNNQFVNNCNCSKK